jgi:glycosyltransferase involved in cell wall biosynthesis
MDSAISILLKTDKLAIVCTALLSPTLHLSPLFPLLLPAHAQILFTSPLMGRDMLPPLHHAVIHDQLHPASPTAACAKLRARLIPHIGDAISRLRFLPPIDDNSFHVLRSHSIAVLDSYPVGMHLPILEAMAAGVPVVLFISSFSFTPSSFH